VNRVAAWIAGLGLAGLITVVADLGLTHERPRQEVLRIYNWSDYIGGHAIADFEKETGIKVIYDTYDSQESVDAKLLAGHSGYDLVVHLSARAARLIKAGVFQPIDRSRLKNYARLNPYLMSSLAALDPGNRYFIPYTWGTEGMVYNIDAVRAAAPDAPLDSLDTIFQPRYAAKLARCGFTVLESPSEALPMALLYEGKDPNSNDPRDYAQAAKLFAPVRSDIRAFDSSNYLNALPNGELCAAMAFSGDYITAAHRAADVGLKIRLRYYVPRSGGVVWSDVWTIPADARNVGAALKFIDYMMRPRVAADTTNAIYYANAIPAADPLVEPAVRADPAIYPDAATLARLHPLTVLTDAAERARTRAWSRIRTGY
jgi:putrescine transport system substrate-binding protein